MNHDAILKLIRSVAGTECENINIEGSANKIGKCFRYGVKPDTNENLVQAKIHGFRERFIISCQSEKAKYFMNIIQCIFGVDAKSPNTKFVKNKLLEYRILDFLFNLTSKPNTSLLTQSQIDFRKENIGYPEINNMFDEDDTLLSDLDEYSHSSLDLSDSNDSLASVESEHLLGEHEIIQTKLPIFEIVKNNEVLETTLPNVVQINVRKHDMDVDFNCTFRNRASNLWRLGYLSQNCKRDKKFTSESVIALNLLWAIQGNGRDGLDILFNEYELTHIPMATINNLLSPFVSVGDSTLKIRNFCEQHQNNGLTFLGMTACSLCTEILCVLQKLDHFVNNYEKCIRQFQTEKFSLLGFTNTLKPWIEFLTILFDIVCLMDSFIIKNTPKCEQNIKLINYLSDLMAIHCKTDPIPQSISDIPDFYNEQVQLEKLIISSIFSIWICSIRIYLNLLDLSLFRIRGTEQIKDNLQHLHDLRDFYYESTDFSLKKIAETNFPYIFFTNSGQSTLVGLFVVAKIALILTEVPKLFNIDKNDLFGDSVFHKLVNHFNLAKNVQIKRETSENFHFGDYITDCDINLQYTVIDYISDFFNSKSELLKENDTEWVFKNELIENPIVVVSNIITDIVNYNRSFYSQKIVHILKTEFNLITHLENIIGNYIFYDSLILHSLFSDIFEKIEEHQNVEQVDKNNLLRIVLDNLNSHGFNGKIKSEKSSFVVDWICHLEVIYPYSNVIRHFINPESFERLFQIRCLILQVVIAKGFLDRIHLRIIQSLITDSYAFCRYCILRQRILSIISIFYRNFTIFAFVATIPDFFNTVKTIDSYEEMIKIWANFVCDIWSYALCDSEGTEPMNIIQRLLKLAEKIYWASFKLITDKLVVELEDEVECCNKLIEITLEHLYVIDEQGKYAWMIKF